MGMFDYVKFKAKCKNCDEILTEWQSKDYKNCLYKISPYRVRRFYTSCDKCKTWNEYEVIPFTIKLINE